MTLTGRALGSSTLPAPNGKDDIAVGMENFKPYDSADYLETEEAIGGFMDAVMEEGGDDPAYVARALGDVARARARNLRGLDKTLPGGDKQP